MAAKLRIIIFAAVIILLSFCMLLSREKSIFQILNVTELTAYTNSNVPNSQLGGNGYYISCSIDEYFTLSDVDGISFETSFTPDEILNKLKLKVLNTQNIIQEDRTIEIFYCFAENLNDFVLINNKKVNMQIAYDGERCIVGLPLILGSY